MAVQIHIVMGGGPVGLTSALLLAEKGQLVIVFERRIKRQGIDGRWVWVWKELEDSNRRREQVVIHANVTRSTY